MQLKFKTAFLISIVIILIISCSQPEQVAVKGNLETLFGSYGVVGEAGFPIGGEDCYFYGGYGYLKSSGKGLIVFPQSDSRDYLAYDKLGAELLFIAGEKRVLALVSSDNLLSWLTIDGKKITIRGSCQLKERVLGISFSGGRLLVAYTSGLIEQFAMVEGANSALTVVSSFNLKSSLGSWLVQGELLFALTGGRISCYLVQADGAWTEQGELDIAGGVGAMALSGGRLAVISGYSLKLIDWTDRQAPFLHSSIDIGAEPTALAAVGETFLVLTKSALKLVELTPSLRVAAVRGLKGSPSGLRVYNGRFYLIDRVLGTALIKHSPNTIEEVGYYRMSGGESRGVALYEKELYVADYRRGMLVYDIGQPAAPELIGLYSSSGGALKVAVSRGLLALALEGSEIVIYSRANPHFGVIGRVKLPGEVTGLFFGGDRLIVTCGYSGLVIVDLADPSRPLIMGRYNAGGRAASPTVQGSYIYFTDSRSGLVVLQLYSSGRISEVTNILPGTEAAAFITGGKRGFLLTSRSIAMLEPVAEPLNCSVVGSTAITGSHSSMALFHNFLFTAGESRLHIYNIKEDRPLILREIALKSRPLEIAVGNNYLYLADSRRGVVVVGNKREDKIK